MVGVVVVADEVVVVVGVVERVVVLLVVVVELVVVGGTVTVEVVSLPHPASGRPTATARAARAAVARLTTSRRGPVGAARSRGSR